jgi:Trypsin-like peptidase domain
MSPPVTIALPSLKSLLVSAWANAGNGLPTGLPSAEHLAHATAFVAVHSGRHFLVTNWHVVAGRHAEDGKPLAASLALPEALLIMHNTDGQIGGWSSRLEPLYDEHDAPLWFEHPTLGRNVDVVALPLTQTDGVRLYPYDPAMPGAPISFGASDLVSIVGFPFGKTGGGAAGIWVQGSVATEPGFNYDDLPCFLVDSRTRQGQSGSPVILYRKGTFLSDDGAVMASSSPVERFVGIYSGRINSESDLGRVWKAHALTEILDGEKRGAIPIIGPPPPRPPN